jgi:large subunit ribosomal protein L10
MKTKQQKAEALQDLQGKLERAKITIFTSYARTNEKGLSVADMRELRKSLRPSDSEYAVEKKTLIQKALEMEGFSDVNTFDFSGSLGVVFGYGDELSSAKALYSFAKTHPGLKYFGGLFEGQFVNEKQIAALGTMPSRDVLIAQTMSMMTYHLRAFMNILGQIGNKNN